MAHIEVPHPGASEIVGRMLSDALSEHPDVQWLGLVSEDGFAIASEGAFDVDDDAVAAGAVRMMIQVRAMSRALNQSGVSQMFLEGSESGICVIDKDPWVLVLVGAPGVPIGLLRYEAREIAEAFPMGQRAALPEAEPPLAMADDMVDVVATFAEEPVAEEPVFAPVLTEPVVEESVDEVTDPDGEPEIRWADEPTIDDAPAADTVFADLTAAPENADDTGVISTDYADWLATTEPEPEPEASPQVVEESFDLVDLADVAPPALADLAPPAGPSIDLPPPAGPAFQLPPPV